MSEMASRRLYLGNLPRDVTKSDVERHFDPQNTGQIAEVKLMSGFGFLEYKDPAAAADAVPALNGTELMGERLVVQFARGTERPPRRDFDYSMQRAPPRPRRTIHRMTLNGLPPETSWQDLKDFARQPGLDVVFSEVGRGRDAEGTGFVEYETGEDLQQAVDKLDGADFKGSVIRCIADTQNEVPRSDYPPPRGGGGGRFRSRSPGPRYGGGRGYDDYDRRGPPPGRYDGGGRDDYRRRSPPRDYGYDRRGPPEPYYGGGGRSPGGPRDDYGPPRRRGYEDDSHGAPARRGGYGGDMNGHGREPRGDYGRERSPQYGERRGGGYDGGYDRRGGY